jgi:O-antigen/teichoic acid export membrane protein
MSAPASERLRLMHDGLINNVGLIISGLVSLILVPVLLTGLGDEAYGLLISAVILEGILGGFDFGLGATVTKEVAGGLSDKNREATLRLVRAATSAQVMIAAAGAVMMVLSGFLLRNRLHLSLLLRGLALPTFGLAGLSLVGSRLMAFSTDLLGGLRRFDLVNAEISLGVMLRAAGVVILLRAGFGLLAIAGWCAFAVVVTAFFGFVLIARVEPRVRFAMSSSVLKVLIPHARFGLGSQIASALSNVIWSGPPLIIGILAGSSPEALFYVGQKFPVALSGISSRIAAVFFPAASEQRRSGNLAWTRDILDVGVRWIVVIVLPAAIVLVIVARVLLKVWVGHAEPGTIMVLRLTVLAVILDAVGQGALNLLWGRGAIRSVLRALGLAAVVAIVLTFVLFKVLGLPGAAAALVAAMAVGTGVVLREAARVAKLEGRNPLFGAIEGLLPAGLACAASAAAVRLFPLRFGWVMVFGASFAGGTAFLSVLYFAGCRFEERRLFEDVLGAASALVVRPFRAAGRAFGTGR